ncbi:hypothetical protein [Hyalangium gracile]|uniref:hypothetical protein n=1 Tax=Hyalangium gracile TaxID=394092 RepID=UPI001CCF3463|nr:hypothetical protein [Hyalangium gracile]
MDPSSSPSSSATVKWLRRIAWVLLAGCCCLWMAHLLGYLGTRTSESSPSPPVTDLGMVLAPPGTPLGQAQTYVWSVEGLKPSRHQVVYGLGPSLIEKIEEDDEALGRRMHFRALSRDRFTFRAPPECRVDMRCIYEELMRMNPEPVEELGERFLAFTRARQLSAAQAAELIIGFVQRIKYELPELEVPFGVTPPALVPARNSGDCDSKALLAVMLLRQVGIDAVVLFSDPLAHAAVGIGLPGSGTTLRHGGRSWRYAEVSVEGWPIGLIPPRYDKPRLWTVVPPMSRDSG